MPNPASLVWPPVLPPPPLLGPSVHASPELPPSAPKISLVSYRLGLKDVIGQRGRSGGAYSERMPASDLAKKSKCQNVPSLFPTHLGLFYDLRRRSDAQQWPTILVRRNGWRTLCEFSPQDMHVHSELCPAMLGLFKRLGHYDPTPLVATQF